MWTRICELNKAIRAERDEVDGESAKVYWRRRAREYSAGLQEAVRELSELRDRVDVLEREIAKEPKG